MFNDNNTMIVAWNEPIKIYSKLSNIKQSAWVQNRTKKHPINENIRTLITFNFLPHV